MYFLCVSPSLSRSVTFCLSLSVCHFLSVSTPRLHSPVVFVTDGRITHRLSTCSHEVIACELRSEA